MHKALDVVVVRNLGFTQIILIEPTSPDGKIYYGLDRYGNGFWFGENEILKDEQD